MSKPEGGVSGGTGQQRGAALRGVLLSGPAHGGNAAVSAQTATGPQHQLQLQQRYAPAQVRSDTAPIMATVSALSL